MSVILNRGSPVESPGELFNSPTKAHQTNGLTLWRAGPQTPSVLKAPWVILMYRLGSEPPSGLWVLPLDHA